MKCNGNRLWITGILLIGLLLGCVTDPASRKRGEASRNLGEAFMSQQNYTSALKELLAAEQLIPDDPYLHDDLGQTYMARERYDLAIDNFKKAIALKPDYAPAINNLGVAYMKQQNWDAAVASFNLITRNLLYAIIINRNMTCLSNVILMLCGFSLTICQLSWDSVKRIRNRERFPRPLPSRRKV